MTKENFTVRIVQPLCVHNYRDVNQKARRVLFRKISAKVILRGTPHEGKIFAKFRLSSDIQSE